MRITIYSLLTLMMLAAITGCTDMPPHTQNNPTPAPQEAIYQKRNTDQETERQETVKPEEEKDPFPSSNQQSGHDQVDSKQFIEPQESADTNSDYTVNSGTAKSSEDAVDANGASSIENLTDNKNQADSKDKTSNSEHTTAKNQDLDRTNKQKAGDTQSNNIPANDQSIRLNLKQCIQENAYFCSSASLQMVLNYHGISVSQTQLAADLNTSSVTGTEYVDLARVASTYIFGKVPESDNEPGYRAVILPAWTSDPAARKLFEERVISDLINGDPVFVSINNETAYGPGYGTVHQVVLYGVDLDESGTAIRFCFRDPSYLQQDPANEGKKILSADELWNCMTQNPEPGYVW